MVRPGGALTTVFSTAQCIGYIAFVLGVSAYSQRSDRRLKALNATESLVYAVHFVLLGNLSASASTLVSGIRSFLAVKYRSPWPAALIVLVNIALGFVFRNGGVGWLPVAASCFATVAVFQMQGIRMRLVLLGCTLLWLANNILTKSIGGTLLEFVIAILNIITMMRMMRVHAQCDAPKDSLVPLR